MAHRVLILVAALAFGGCGDETGGTDAGPDPTDSGPTDSGMVEADAGSDAGSDAGPGSDAGSDAGGGDDAGTDGGGTDGGGTDGGGTDGGGGGVSIPEPGAFTNRWSPPGTIDVPAGHGTPGTAFQVGTISVSPTYIGGTFDPVTGNVYWVFRTGAAMTTFNAVVRGGAGIFTFMHLHDGAGGVFGAEVPPTAYDDSMDWMIGATWTVMPDHVYVLEVQGSMGSFF